MISQLQSVTMQKRSRHSAFTVACSNCICMSLGIFACNCYFVCKYLLTSSLLIFIAVGPKSGGSSDTSPPTMQSFAEESSPENLRLLTGGQSTESLDSLSDESGGVQHRQRRHQGIKSRNPAPPPRKV